jgi:hypothetical protein
VKIRHDIPRATAKTCGERQAAGKAPTGRGFGEEFLGALLDQGHELPPYQLGPLVARQTGRRDGRETSVFLRDYGQVWLVPLPGDGLAAGEPQPIDGSDAGRAFQEAGPVEVPRADGVRGHLPLLDGGDRVGVMAVALDRVHDDLRLLLGLAPLVADMLVTKHGYTDLFLPAAAQSTDECGGGDSVVAAATWSCPRPGSGWPGCWNPPMTWPATASTTPSTDVPHAAMVDAMGHGLDAAAMATVVIGAYRHARRISVGLSEIYASTDRAVAEQFGPDHFVTAQMMRLDTATGRLQWVNAGHPAPLLIRGHRVVRRLHGPTTLPVGFGGHEPRISGVPLAPGDRVLCFTDGLIEERDVGGEEFGEEQLIAWVNRLEPTAQEIRTVACSHSHTLQGARGGITTDDATLLLIECRGSG